MMLRVKRMKTKLMMMRDTAVSVHDGCDDGGDQFSRLSSQLRSVLVVLDSKF